MVTRWSALLPLAVSLASGVVTVEAQDTTQVDSTRAPVPLLFTIPGSLLARLPIDDPRQALHLAPGVVLRGTALAPFGATQAAIRGGEAAEPSAYLDGAPIRLQTFGSQQLALSPFMVSMVSVEPGVPDVTTGDARGGVVSYVTPTGSARYHGRLRAETDEAFGNGASVGFNRLEGFAGGPVPGIGNLTFFGALQLQGQASHYRGLGAADQPTYVVAGLDTTVQMSDGSGGTLNVPVPAFTQWSGDCDGCLGLRRPMDWASHARLLGKVAYDDGQGSRVSLTALAAGFQERYFPGTRIGAPSLYEGTHAWSRLVVLDAHHRLGDVNGPTLHANLSYAKDRAISGALATASELNSRAPGLGIGLTPLQFAGLEAFPFPITEEIVRNSRTNAGLRTPYLDREDLRNRQLYRLNPFGLLSGWPTEGLDASISLLHERRLHARVAVEVTPRSGHRVTAGVEGDVTDVSYYRSDLLRQGFSEVMVLEPRTSGVFLADRMTSGDVELDVGIRYDRVNPGGEFPDVPGRIFTHPTWNPSDYEASVAAVMTEARVQDAISPRVRFAYRPGNRTTFRLGVGQYLAAPPYADLFAHANSDLAFTNTLAGYGRDVDFIKVTQMEAGLAHVLQDGVEVGVTGYRKAPGRAHGFRFRRFEDPLNPGDTLLINSLARVDDGDIVGLDAGLALHRDSAISAWAGYSLAVVRPDDLPGPAGSSVNQPNFATQQVSVLVSGAVPDGWRSGTALGRLAAGVGAVAVFRAMNGFSYTRLANQGGGYVAPGPIPFPATQIEPLNASSLPWTKHLDLRVTRRSRVGRLDWTVYADIRNVFAFRNIEALFAETGDVRNDAHRANVLSPAYVVLVNEAQNNGALMAGNTVDVRGCGAWQDPVNCVALSRVASYFADATRSGLRWAHTIRDVRL